MELGRRLRTARKLKGLSQSKLGEKIDVHEMTIRRWEVGDRYPNADDLVKLSTALDTTIAALMGEDDTASEPADASGGTAMPPAQEERRADMRYWGEVFDRAEAAAARRDAKELLRVRLMLSEALAEVDGALSRINQRKLAS